MPSYTAVPVLVVLVVRAITRKATTSWWSTARLWAAGHARRDPLAGAGRDVELVVRAGHLGPPEVDGDPGADHAADDLGELPAGGDHRRRRGRRGVRPLE